MRARGVSLVCASCWMKWTSRFCRTVRIPKVRRGYHRLKLELLLYSLMLCRENGIEIEQKYWQKLRAMAEYTRAYLRPDGHAPLIGDSDSGQILPIVKRAGDDHAYVVGLAAAVFHESRLKATSAIPEEVLWILGEQGVRDYESLSVAPPAESQAFPDAGIYILRDDDLYLLFNASGCGLNGRGSHGHNDALSIEVSACGTAFIVDPGSYVYTADLQRASLCFAQPRIIRRFKSMTLSKTRLTKRRRL